MGVEYERKFVVTSDYWKRLARGVETLIAQGYISVGPNASVRVRIGGGRGWITIKGNATGHGRPEFEYEVPTGEARELMKMAIGTVEKTRHTLHSDSREWTVDVFHGPNLGLVLLEIEDSVPIDDLRAPEWAAVEVTHDQRFTNAYLSQNPYSQWGDHPRTN